MREETWYSIQDKTDCGIEQNIRSIGGCESQLCSDIFFYMEKVVMKCKKTKIWVKLNMVVWKKLEKYWYKKNTFGLNLRKSLQLSLFVFCGVDKKNSAEMIQIITLMKNIRLKEGILSTEVTRKKCICSIILHVIL